MRVTASLLALTAFLTSARVEAQLPAGVAAQIDALPIEKVCSADGALGIGFGSTDHGISPIHKPGTVNRDLGPEFAPFRLAALNATKYSRQFYAAALMVDLGDAAIEQEAIDRLADRIEAAGWVPSVRAVDDDGPLFDIAAGEGDWLFYSAEGVESPGSGQGTRLLVSHSLGELAIDCEHIPLTKVQFEEAFGKMPADTPRPKFISSMSMMGFPESDCSIPEKRAFIIDRMRRGDMMMMAPGADRVAYEEALADWKIMKLVASGKTDRQTLSDKIIGLLDEPETQAAMQAPMEMMVSFASALESVQPGDDAGLCRAVHAMLLKGEAATASIPGATGDAVTSQWLATHRLLDREAARLGVSFAE